MYTRKKIMKRNGIKKRILTTALAFTIVLGIAMSNVPTMVTDGASVKVEAASKKKDKKKPVIKMSGKSKITVTKGTSVKIPKVTAKDNKDGNVTKKIKVTVKKGKKSYSSIAKKIKNNKKVKFTATGKYTITYTVKDKAGNKATKKRYVTVKKKETTAEKITMPDVSAYGHLKEIEVAGNKYYFLDNKTNKYQEIEGAYLGEARYKKLAFEKWEISTLVFDSTIKDYSVDQQYLSFVGKITVVDEQGVDCSNRIFVAEKELADSKEAYIYYVNSKGEIICINRTNIYSNTYIHDEGALKDAEWDYSDDVNKVYIKGIKESSEG